MGNICNTCNAEKELDEFPIVLGCKGNRRPKCKACVAEGQRQWHLRRNPIEGRPRQIAKKLFERGLKACRECREVKPLSEYWANSRWPNGYNPYCKECNRTKFKVPESRPVGRPYKRADYDKEYRSREHVKERRVLSRKERYSRSPRNIMQTTLRHGLKRRPTENPATIDDLMTKFAAQDGRCAVSGIVMTWNKGTVLPTSISLDRIDPSGGYSADNLRLVCHAVNAFKGRMSDAEMLIMAKAIVDNVKVKAPEPHWASGALSMAA